MKKIFVLFLLVLLTGCATTKVLTEPQKPTITKNLMQKEFDILPPPNGKKVAVAVYSFADKTGQRRPSATMAQLSTAVTQGAEAFLIKALQDVGRGEWFDVVERVGIDNLTKERMIIRQMREAYEGDKAKPLSPAATSSAARVKPVMVALAVLAVAFVKFFEICNFTYRLFRNVLFLGDVSVFLTET